ncbi:APH(3') family aminoglycoside O-phosphotransferase [Aquibacillus albus]|uniref:Kanamycin kinase/aminoglycoside 3'-phosphotransferase-2 n=1 Tax=Aquibacillus albus TaxID=1168171 RepID=A0ABS2N0K5_9BACI|nr:APH(3') family aminoglycoside O-phosphotransferase [Aquibacillus albus]MBM7571686.1 kanamycin kinase/aminoglycoside 3'-phosphotransferase-2 [Aquibacillus albus]
MKGIPQTLAKFTNGYKWKQITIGQSDAMTFLLRGTTYNQYLKIQPNNSVESLYKEKERLEWLQGKVSVPEVLYYDKDEVNEYLLITEIKGINASDKSYETNLPFTMKLLAIGLKTLHSLSIEGCPFNQKLDVKMEEAKNRVENGLVDEEDFDNERKDLKARELFEELISKKPINEELVFTHGDYCLPNIIIDKDKVSGFIDLGRAGISDRYQDLALAVRSITYNFGKEHVPLFLKAYGIEKLDESKIFYYQLLDEFF